MCIVSAVTDYGQRTWPNPATFPEDLYKGWSKLVQGARDLDKAAGEPDCVDPIKDAWEKKLEKLMREKYGLEPKV